MTTIKIDNKDYDLESLSPEARVQIFSLQATEAEIQRLNILLLITLTARNAYAKDFPALLAEPIAKKWGAKSGK